jgi:hypothetical protein
LKIPKFCQPPCLHWSLEVGNRLTSLEGAFRVLGPGPTDRELRLVRQALLAAGAFPQAEPFAELVAIAERNGSSGFVALDLITEPVEADEDDERLSA